MATAQLSTAAFVEVLGTCGLLEPPRLGQLTGNSSLLGADPHRLAFQLVQQGWLTPYQVNRVLAGRGTELVLGHYILLERLGEGGMAQVFKARHRMINRIVALKVIRPDHLNNRETLARFRREVRAVSQLSHPNIVAALDADEVDGTYFFVMEFVDGVDLGRLVKRSGALAVAQTCDYVRQAACGLAHAHEKGLVHRDIKPSNLMVTQRPTGDSGGDPHPWGLVKVLDMGLARSRTKADAEESAAVTHAGLVIGTPDFLAPEQAADAKQADIRADIYSLGGTAYYLLTGQVPFPGGSTIDKLVRQRFEEPRPLRQLRPEVPAALADFVHRMLSRQTADRPQTPSEVAGELRRWCEASGEATAIRPTAPPTSPEAAAETPLPPPATVVSRVRADRRRWNLGVAAGAACLAAGLGLLFFLLGRGGKAPANRPLPPDDPLQPFLAQADKPGCNFAQLRSELIAFRMLHRDTPLARRATELLRRLPSAFDGLAIAHIRPDQRFPVHNAELAAVLGDGRLRHWGKATAVACDSKGQFLVSGGEDRQLYIWDPASGKRRSSLPGHAGAISSVAVGREGKLIFSAGHDHTVRIWDLASRKEIVSLKHPSPVQGLALSPDGKQLASVTRGQHGAPGGTVHIWDLGRRKEKFVLSGHQGPVRAVAYSPDGRLIASAGEDGTIRIWDAGKEAAGLRGHQGPVLALAFVGDGNTLASGGADKSLRIWDVAGRKERHGPRGHLHPVSALAALPGGTLVAAGCHDGLIKLWDTANGQDRGTFNAGAAIAALAPFPAGQRLAAAVHDRSVRIWDIPGQRECTPYDPEAIITMALAPDDQLLATGHIGGKLRLRNPATRSKGVVLEGHQRGVSALAFSPDGRLLVSGGSDNQAVLWNPASGKSRFHLNGHCAPVAAVAFAPNGRWLATASHDKTAKLWDASSGRERATLAGHREGLSTIAVAPDGRTVATGSFDRQARLWDAASGKQRAVFPEFHGESLLFTPDGKALAGGSEHGTVRLWNVAKTAAFHAELSGVHLLWPRAFAASADGGLLAVAGVDGLVVIWDLAHHREFRRLQYPGFVHDLAFTGDGRHLISANGNGTVAVVRLLPAPTQARRGGKTRSLPSKTR